MLRRHCVAQPPCGEEVADTESLSTDLWHRAKMKMVLKTPETPLGVPDNFETAMTVEDLKKDLDIADKLLAKRDEQLHQLQRHEHISRMRNEQKMKELQALLKTKNQQLVDLEQLVTNELERQSKELIIKYVAVGEECGPEGEHSVEELRKQVAFLNNQLKAKSTLLENQKIAYYALLDRSDRRKDVIRIVEKSLIDIKERVQNLRMELNHMKIAFRVKNDSDLNFVAAATSSWNQLVFAERNQVTMFLEAAQAVFSSTILFLPSAPGYVIPICEPLQKEETDFSVDLSLNRRTEVCPEQTLVNNQINYCSTSLAALSKCLAAYSNVCRTEAEDRKRERLEHDEAICILQCEVEALNENLQKQEKEITKLQSTNKELLKETLRGSSSDDGEVDGNNGETTQTQFAARIAWLQCSKQGEQDSLIIPQLREELHECLKHIAALEAELEGCKNSVEDLKEQLKSERAQRVVCSQESEEQHDRIVRYKKRLVAFKSALDERERLLVTTLKQTKINDTQKKKRGPNNKDSGPLGFSGLPSLDNHT